MSIQKHFEDVRTLRKQYPSISFLEARRIVSKQTYIDTATEVLTLAKSFVMACSETGVMLAYAKKLRELAALQISFADEIEAKVKQMQAQLTIPFDAIQETVEAPVVEEVNAQQTVEVIQEAPIEPVEVFSDIHYELNSGKTYRT